MSVADKNRETFDYLGYKTGIKQEIVPVEHGKESKAIQELVEVEKGKELGITQEVVTVAAGKETGIKQEVTAPFKGRELGIVSKKVVLVPGYENSIEQEIIAPLKGRKLSINQELLPNEHGRSIGVSQQITEVIKGKKLDVKQQVVDVVSSHNFKDIGIKQEVTEAEPRDEIGSLGAHRLSFFDGTETYQLGYIHNDTDFTHKIIPAVKKSYKRGNTDMAANESIKYFQETLTVDLFYSAAKEQLFKKIGTVEGTLVIEGDEVNKVISDVSAIADYNNILSGTGTAKISVKFTKLNK